MKKLIFLKVLGFMLIFGYGPVAEANFASARVSSQANMLKLNSVASPKDLHKIAGLGKVIRKGLPGSVPGGLKALPSRPKAGLPPRGLQRPKGLSNAPAVRAGPPAAPVRAPRAANALPPRSAGKLPPATGVSRGANQGFVRANVPSGPRRFDGDTVGIGNRAVRKATAADNIPTAAAKPSAWKKKALLGGIGVFIVLQFAPDLVISQIDFSTDEEKAAEEAAQN